MIEGDPLNQRVHGYCEAMLTTTGGLALIVMDAADAVAHILGPVAVVVGVFATVIRLYWDWRREMRDDAERALHLRKNEALK